MLSRTARTRWRKLIQSVRIISRYSRFLLIPMLEFKLLQFVNVFPFIDVSPQSFQ